MRLIGYLTSGYPTVQQSIETAGLYVQGGCDMLEISIPLEENREKPFLAEIMREAWRGCPDYDRHLWAIEEMARRNPGIEITILLYDEVVEAIGPERFVEFCRRSGIRDVNSANLKSERAIALFNENGIRIAGLVNYNLEERRIEEAVHATGFVYCQAFPREGQQLKEGLDSIDKLIPYLRGRGIKNPIYCGGGVSTPEDAARVKAAGADGVFLGSSIIAMYDRPHELIDTIKKYRNAIN